MKTFIIEAIALIIIFTVGIVMNARNPLNVVCDLPEPIQKRCLELGLIDESKLHVSPQTKIKKLFAALFFVVIFVVFLYFVNHAKTFKDGFIISYVLWLIVDWYDFFVLDWFWCCHSKRFIIPGTEDLMEYYKDYKFHFMGSVKGMFIGLPVCVIVGLVLQAFTLLI